jgi:hypothetical protein
MSSDKFGNVVSYISGHRLGVRVTPWVHEDTLGCTRKHLTGYVKLKIFFMNTD